ncbi:C40 family peptidase [Daejeonella lutea]|uniref:Lipoprotein Spr n=1 Tax=Daejeonella lutea TaxID=572036 RepID=A0A1T5APM2_9SPHI|nr:NlpC/P60 family protein [Daejeonella lutea]SKB36942.1 lipoprotein Spr [Daejeonella lutea]
MISYLRSKGIYIILFPALLLYSSCKSKKILTDSSKARSVASGSLTERYAALLNVKEKELGNEKLYRFIDSWMGVPHRSGGMDKKGIDCSGFTSILEKEIYNRAVPRTAKSMAESVKRKYEEDLKEGDLVFFDFQGQKFSHVGVYLHNNKFVHASTSKGVIISDLKDPWYYKYFSRAGSIKN